jgi:hypothetical protein
MSESEIMKEQLSQKQKNWKTPDNSKIKDYMLMQNTGLAFQMALIIG